jgi:hypothetical protein
MVANLLAKITVYKLKIYLTLAEAYSRNSVALDAENHRQIFAVAR